MKSFIPGILLSLIVAAAFGLGSNWKALQPLFFKDAAVAESPAPTAPQAAPPAPPAPLAPAPQPPRSLPPLAAAPLTPSPPTGDIVQTQGLAAAPLPLALGQFKSDGGLAITSIREIGGADTEWKPGYSGNLYLTGTTCRIEVTGAELANLKSSNPDAKYASGVLTFPLGKKITFQLVTNDEKKTDDVTVWTQAAMSKPQIKGAANGDYTPAAATDLKVFNGYLRLKVYCPTSVTQLKLLTFTNAKVAYGKPIQLNGPVGAGQEVEVKLEEGLILPPDGSGAGTGILKLVAEANDQAVLAVQPLTFTYMDTNSTAPGVPVRTDFSVNTKTDASFDTKTTRLTIAAVNGGTGVAIPDQSQLYMIVKPQGPQAALEVLLQANKANDSSDRVFKGPFAFPPSTSKPLPDGVYELFFEFRRGGRAYGVSEPTIVRIRTEGPRVEEVLPPDFGSSPGVAVRVRFSYKMKSTADDEKPDDQASAEVKASANRKRNYLLEDMGDSPAAPRNPSKVEYAEDTNTVTLTFNDLVPGKYQLRVRNTIEDSVGNRLEGAGKGKLGTDYVYSFSRMASFGGGTPPAESLGRGITGTTGDYVPFPEFTPFRKGTIGGFNPGDHVETRVVRLYYFRDAHRVAQIVNRAAKSYNMPAVAITARLADQSRDKANVLTDDRRRDELRAIRAAEETRVVEKQLASASRRLDDLNAQLANNPDDKAKQQLNAEIKNVEDQASSFRSALQTKRQAEIAANEQALITSAAEDRAREEQFRRYTAAGHVDPDTYVPGIPNSIDPVQQVSISVIGEAVIQLRGPISGINIIRKMIHEIDAPVGQVRVAMHTVQVNGEHGDRMEKVIAKIQDSIDQSRFMTVQSALMLRKAIVSVASRKATSLVIECPQDSQQARDEKYLYAFFGRDFVQELKSLDSEFLRTGNKLLALNSMDTTSLAAGLFVMALAKNTVRQEILVEFQRLLCEELPVAEQNYLMARGFRKHHEHIILLSPNAKFQSFMGFFNTDIVGDDTLSPIQREFIRLAQIFKSQLVTELELKQRVIERSLLEERIGKDYLKELDDLRQKDQAALDDLLQTQKGLRELVPGLAASLATILAEIDTIRDEHSQLHCALNEASANVERYLKVLHDSATTFAAKNGKGNEAVMKKIEAGIAEKPETRNLPTAPQKMLYYLWTLQKDDKRKQENSKELEFLEKKAVPHFRKTFDEIAISNPFYLILFNNKFTFSPDITGKTLLTSSNVDEWKACLLALKKIAVKFDDFNLSPVNFGRRESAKLLVDSMLELQKSNKGEIEPLALQQSLQMLLQIAIDIKKEADSLSQTSVVVYAELQNTNPDIQKVYVAWVELSNRIKNQLSDKGELGINARKLLNDAGSRFQSVAEKGFNIQVKRQEAQAARRPLDHKKFLDMLIEEYQDKYVELQEGTRSYISNIDDYIKRVATALEDDFNTQYYHPAFAQVRKASRLWDVTLGQIETTSILANNRSFAAVEPQATMEFDLPRRDILVTEAMKTSKGLVDTYGALLQDPTFLSLSKLRSCFKTIE